MTRVSPRPNTTQEEEGLGHPIPQAVFGGMGGDALIQNSHPSFTT